MARTPHPDPQTVAEAAATGDRHALLVALRDRIAQAISDPDCPPRELAALARRLQDIARELEVIGAAESAHPDPLSLTEERRRRRRFDPAAL